MCSIASWREVGVAGGALVTIRLPFDIQWTATRLICIRVTLLSFVLSVLHICLREGQALAYSPKCVRSTTRLGLRGLNLATAK